MVYNGNEQFMLDGKESGTSILDFWRWAYSGLSDNVERGVLAEFLVKSAMGYAGDDTNEGKRVWHCYDLVGPHGIRLEVKSVVRNYARGENKDKMVFNIAQTRMFCEYRESYSVEKDRHSDIFIFCIWNCKDSRQDPINIDDWEFYVVSTKLINECFKDQKSISYKALLALKPTHCSFANLRDGIILEYYNRGPFTFKQPISEGESEEKDPE